MDIVWYPVDSDNVPGDREIVGITNGYHVGYAMYMAEGSKYMGGSNGANQCVAEVDEWRIAIPYPPIAGKRITHWARLNNLPTPLEAGLKLCVYCLHRRPHETMQDLSTCQLYPELYLKDAATDCGRWETRSPGCQCDFCKGRAGSPPECTVDGLWKILKKEGLATD